MLSVSYAAVTTTALVAQPAPWESMGSRFRKGGPRSDGGEALWALAGLVAAVAAVVLASRWFTRDDKPCRYAHPRKLFDALAKAHGLLPAERRLVLCLARRHGLEHPALVFVDRRYWRSKGHDGSATERELLAQIEERLFSGPTADVTPQAASSEATSAPAICSAAPVSPTA